MYLKRKISIRKLGDFNTAEQEYCCENLCFFKRDKALKESLFLICFA